MDIFGPQVIGDLKVDITVGMPATGGVASVSMAVLTMGSVISDPVLSAVDGKATDFSVTPRFGM